MPESVYVIASIPADIEDFVTLNLILDLIMDLRGDLQVLTVFRVTLFHYKVVFIKVTLL